MHLIRGLKNKFKKWGSNMSNITVSNNNSNKCAFEEGIKGLNRLYLTMGIGYTYLYDNCTVSQGMLGTAVGIYDVKDRELSGDIMVKVARSLLKVNNDLWQDRELGKEAANKGKYVSDETVHRCLAPLLVNLSDLGEEGKRTELESLCSMYRHEDGEPEHPAPANASKLAEYEEKVVRVQYCLNTLMTAVGVTLDDIAPKGSDRMSKVRCILGLESPSYGELKYKMPYLVVDGVCSVTEMIMKAADESKLGAVAANIPSTIAPVMEFCNEYCPGCSSVDSLQKTLLEVCRATTKGVNAEDARIRAITSAFDSVDDVMGDEYMSDIGRAQIAIRILIRELGTNEPELAAFANLDPDKLSSILGHVGCGDTWPQKGTRMSNISAALVNIVGVTLRKVVANGLPTPLALRVRTTLSPLFEYLIKYKALFSLDMLEELLRKVEAPAKEKQREFGNKVKKESDVASLKDDNGYTEAARGVQAELTKLISVVNVSKDEIIATGAISPGLVNRVLDDSDAKDRWPLSSKNNELSGVPGVVVLMASVIIDVVYAKSTIVTAKLKKIEHALGVIREFIDKYYKGTGADLGLSSLETRIKNKLTNKELEAKKMKENNVMESEGGNEKMNTSKAVKETDTFADLAKNEEYVKGVVNAQEGLRMAMSACAFGVSDAAYYTSLSDPCVGYILGIEHTGSQWPFSEDDGIYPDSILVEVATSIVTRAKGKVYNMDAVLVHLEPLTVFLETFYPNSEALKRLKKMIKNNTPANAYAKSLEAARMAIRMFISGAHLKNSDASYLTAFRDSEISCILGIKNGDTWPKDGNKDEKVAMTLVDVVDSLITRGKRISAPIEANAYQLEPLIAFVNNFYPDSATSKKLDELIDSLTGRATTYDLTNSVIANGRGVATDAGGLSSAGVNQVATFSTIKEVLIRERVVQALIRSGDGDDAELTTYVIGKLGITLTDVISAYKSLGK